jgi:ElaB/YqjD/DUF883 family membrane-anchored ribosome-binding protein
MRAALLRSHSALAGAERIATEATMNEASTEKLMKDLRAVIADAEALMAATADTAGTEVREARARAEETFEQARARLESFEEELQAHAKEALGDADVYVRENPWQSIGIAAAIGLVLGLLIGRR